MEGKRFQGLLLGLLLVLGISSSAMGQLQGYQIKLVRPDSGKVVAIGDSVVVDVVSIGGTVPNSVSVRVVDVFSTADTIVTKAAIDSATGSTRFQRTAVQVSGVTPPTFRIAFPIIAGDPEKLLNVATPKRLAVIASVTEGATTTKFSSLNKASAIFVDPAKGAIGDGKVIGIDGQRPTIAANVDTVYLDANLRVGATALVDGPSSTSRHGFVPRQLSNSSRFGFKAGETVGVNLVLSSAGNSNVLSGNIIGAVILVDSVQIVSEATARAKVRFLTSAILASDTFKVANDTSATGFATTRVAVRFGGDKILRRAIILSAGQFPNNANVTATAYLIDAAGNLSGINASDATPAGVTASLTYLVDTVVPVFSSVYPDSAGKRFTGTKSVLRDTINSAGTALVNSRFGQRPLKWSLSEISDSLKITIGGKTWTRGAGTATQAALIDSFEVTETGTGTLATTAATGTAYDITLAATDSVGNTATTSVTGAILDSTSLQFVGQFPRMINKANKDTFNAATSSVVFTLSEAADSIRINYRKLGVSTGAVSTARGQGGGNININLTSTTSQRIDVSTDSLKDQSFYSLQLYGRDLAYNWTVTGPDTLFYSAAFKNPNADTIRVLVNSGSNDTVVVAATGTGVLLDVAAIDTVLKGVAVTYGPTSVVVDVWSPDSTKDLSQVHIKGTGVTEVPALVGKIRRATLNNSDWVLGARTITVSDSMAQNGLYVTVRDTAKASRRGKSVALVFETGQLTKYKLMVAAPASTVMDTSTVAANSTFVVNVQPQDKFGNPSLKTVDAIYNSGTGSGLALSEIYVEFAADAADLFVPAGPQRLSSTGWYAFDFEAPNRNDMFRISARTANEYGVAVGTSQDKAVGHTWIKTTGAGGVVGPPPPPGTDPTVARPDTLIVEDYKGPDGSGDQGGFVMVTLKNTAQHPQLSQYRIWREMLVSTSYDTATKRITSATPVLRWVPWAVVDAVPVLQGQPPITRAVVPTIDGVATRWAVTAEMGGKSSEAATSSAAGARQGKVVFSAESVKETLALLGINSVMLQADLEKIISPSYEFTQALLGDRKDLLYGRLDLDGLRQIAMKVPEGVRAATEPIRASGATLAVAAVRAMDNLPPAAVASEQETHTTGREVTLTWTASKDDRVVGFIPYRGYATPIAGVRTYDVFRGQNEEGLVKIASLTSGSTTFKDVVDPSLGNKLVYRIDATDLDNITKGKLVNVVFQAVNLRKIYRTANNLPVYLMLSEIDPSFNATEDFDDFFAFADVFGKTKGQAGFNLQADVDDDADIDFDDFFAFADAFGQVAVLPPRSGKLVGRASPMSGANRDAGLDLKLVTERVLAGQQMTLDVSITNVAALKGYGFTLTYDPQKFELVEATAGDQNLLSQGGNTPVFLKHVEAGQVQLANAIAGDGAVAGSGNVARLVFNVKGEFDDIARFEIADGVLIDGSRLLNPVVTLGALEIQTTPKEFALNQNFPNPFNPETTIKYALAEGSRIELRIYNMVGQVIRTLVNERQNAGRYSIRWDGKDDHGLSVSSGIYFYRLNAEKFNSVKKLMLLK